MGGLRKGFKKTLALIFEAKNFQELQGIFMKAFFDLKEVRQSWSKPNEPKKITAKEVIAEEGEQFDMTEKNEPMFRLLRANGGKVLLEYNRAYTLKGYEQPLSRTVWMEERQTIEFSSLWNNNGLTKKLTLKKISNE